MQIHENGQTLGHFFEPLYSHNGPLWITMDIYSMCIFPDAQELLRHSGAERDPSSVMEDHEGILFELLPSLEDLQEGPQAGPSCGYYQMTLEMEEDERVGVCLRVVDTLH